jgi:hypothetical protein
MVRLLGPGFGRSDGFDAVANALTKLSEQGKVLNYSDLNVVDVLVAEFRESIKPAIPYMITFLNPSIAPDVLKAVANALSKLSDNGKISNFPALLSLMYS